MSFNSWMNSIADAGRDLIRRTQNNDQPADIEFLCAELCSNKGEALGTALACAVVNAYVAMNDKEKLSFFKLLVRDYSADPANVIRCADAYKQDPSAKNLSALQTAGRSPRKQLFSRINMSPTGTRTLVNLRKDLLAYLKEHEELRAVDSDLQDLLVTWFNRGFLKIHSISWKTPAHILEKLIAYEAVHQMNGWDDLRRRLESDRRCFAFFHPALKDEPLIFVEVALTHGVATAVQPLLAPKTEGLEQEPADTAIFYSISNCQEGLRGISFGNFLIKQVVMELREELPQLKNFCTLSPIPGMSRWLGKELAKSSSDLFNAKERVLLDQLSLSNWHTDPQLNESMKPLMMRLGAHYLHNEKRNEQPLDPVARFHLGNGARIKQLNWMGDTSQNGLKQSAAMLVNYHYELGSLEENHEAFVNEHKVACSKKFAAMLND